MLYRDIFLLSGKNVEGVDKCVTEESYPNRMRGTENIDSASYYLSHWDWALASRPHGTGNIAQHRPFRIHSMRNIPHRGRGRDKSLS